MGIKKSLPHMNRPIYLTEKNIINFIEQALVEDIGEGDHSSLASISPDQTGAARLIIKDKGMLAGVELAGLILNHIDDSVEIDFMKQDGDLVVAGDTGFMIKGKIRSILAAERLLLNCMQRMSGIATYTHYLNSLISGTSAKLLDTRKTTPNFRLPEKWAVAIGGGINHRFGLYDMIMLKDNHIDYAGGIRAAITTTLKYLDQKNLDLKIEVETRTLEEVQEVLDTGGIHRIMLDNMEVSTLRQAVELIRGRYQTEASGGITEETIAQVASTGVDFISVGALTHSVTSLDISLKATRQV
ncbi:MAG: nicotinate-nucleotide diphosphorylase (carboxylating) [Cyclobacteriaceae bacterium]|nr:MAG: nicotinate-nucleotide diphosphorylase (carboxylating) [Cyclobacteriaceae bacterium]